MIEVLNFFYEYLREASKYSILLPVLGGVYIIRHLRKGFLVLFIYTFLGAVLEFGPDLGLFKTNLFVYNLFVVFQCIMIFLVFYFLVESKQSKKIILIIAPLIFMGFCIYYCFVTGGVPTDRLEVLGFTVSYSIIVTFALFFWKNVNPNNKAKNIIRIGVVVYFTIGALYFAIFDYALSQELVWKITHLSYSISNILFNTMIFWGFIWKRRQSFFTIPV